MSKNTYFATDENGEKVKYTVLFSFDNPETNLSYVVYTDENVDEDGSTRAYAASYVMDGEDMELSPIETEEEWSVIEELLNELYDSEEDND